LPKPGPWMVTFKQAMGFVLLATAIWLLFIVGDLLDARGVVWTVAFLGFLGLSVWLIGKTQFHPERRARIIAWAIAVALALFGYWFCFVRMYDLRGALRTPDSTATGDLEPEADRIEAALASADWRERIPWQPWQPGLPEELARRGHPVFVDFTASWCVTCQTNKATSLEIESTREKMRTLRVIPLKADYTRRDASIRTHLVRFGHNSVPLNLVYPAGRPDAPIQLPVLLTPGIVQDALERAAAAP